jgi:hypothetical protein
VKLDALKSIVIGITLLLSEFAKADMITFNDYTLDEATNIVTKDSMEWLQWDVTLGMSIVTALEAYANDGWELASNDQMAGLFDDFGYRVTTCEKVYKNGLYLSGIDKILAIFGNTYTEEGGVYGFGNDKFEYSDAAFGSDLDEDELYNFAYIFSAGIEDGNQFGDKISISADTLHKDTENSRRGVALVRLNNVQPTNDVPEPSSLAIFVLGMFGLALRRLKK